MQEIAKIKPQNTKISSQLLQSLGKSRNFAHTKNEEKNSKTQQEHESKRNRLLNRSLVLGICPTFLINVKCLTNKHREGCAVLAYPSFVVCFKKWKKGEPNPLSYKYYLMK